MPKPRSFSEIFEEIHSQMHNETPLNAGWETFLEPAGLSQLLGKMEQRHFSGSLIYRYPRAPRQAHILNAEETMAYEILKACAQNPFHPGFSRKELKSAYRQALLKTHPDQGGSAETFQQVRKSYEILDHFVTKEA